MDWKKPALDQTTVVTTKKKKNVGWSGNLPTLEYCGGCSYLAFFRAENMLSYLSPPPFPDIL